MIVRRSQRVPFLPVLPRTTLPDQDLNFPIDHSNLYTAKLYRILLAMRCIRQRMERTSYLDWIDPWDLVVIQV